MRKEYVDKFTCVKPLLDEASKGAAKVGLASLNMSPQNVSKRVSLSQLTKNALQNVV